MSQDATKKKEKPLSIREKRFVKYLSAGLSQTDAAIKAGYSALHANTFASKKIKECQIMTAIQVEMEKQGLTDTKLISVLKNGIDANKVISANVIAENGEGMKDANSMTKDFVEVPDWIARHKFTDTALKLKGSYPSEKVDVSGNLEVLITREIVQKSGT